MDCTHLFVWTARVRPWLEEMVTVLAHHFQRHHLITKFVAPESNAIVRGTAKPQSKFLSSFLGGRATE